MLDSRYLNDELITGLNYSLRDDSSKAKFDLSLYSECINGLKVKKGLDCPIATVAFEGEDLSAQRIGPFQKPALIDLEFSLNSPRCFRSYYQPARNMPRGQTTDYPYLLRANVGCSDELDEDLSTRLGVYLERELYEKNGIYENLTASFFLYEYFLNFPGNLMNLYTYHSFGFKFVAYSHSRMIAERSVSKV